MAMYACIFQVCSKIARGHPYLTTLDAEIWTDVLKLVFISIQIAKYENNSNDGYICYAFVIFLVYTC